MLHPWTHASCHVIDISSNKSCKTKLITYVLHTTGMPMPHFLSNPFDHLSIYYITMILSSPTALMIRHASRHKGLNQLLQKLGTYMTGNDMNVFTILPLSQQATIVMNSWCFDFHSSIVFHTLYSFAVVFPSWTIDNRFGTAVIAGTMHWNCNMADQQRASAHLS